jgi:hypothetical protein
LCSGRPLPWNCYFPEGETGTYVKRERERAREREEGGSDMKNLRLHIKLCKYLPYTCSSSSSSSSSMLKEGKAKE